MINLDIHGNPIVIHYGSRKFDVKKFIKIKNDWIKPNGGLWTSPVDSNFGWKEWCEAERFRKCTSYNSFKLKFKSDVKFCIIETLDDLKNNMFWLKNTNRFINYPDYEKMAELYDAIWLTEDGQWNTRLTVPNLYGWDCESVLILNSTCCEPI